MRTLLLWALWPLLLAGQDPKALMQSAEDKMKAGDWKAAEAVLTQTIEAGETKGRPFYLRGACRLALKDYEGAVLDLTEAMDRGGGGADVYSLRGTARFMAGDASKAVSDLSEGTEDRKNPDTLVARGHAYFVLESWENALRDFRAASNAATEREEALRCLIWVARSHAGDREAATRDLKSRPPKGWMAQVASYLVGATSEENLLRAASLEPESSRPFARAAAWYYIGSRRLLDGKEDPEAFRKALKSDITSEHFNALARGQLDAWAARDRRRLLNDQYERCRKLKRFHAEFRLRALSEKGEEVNKEDEATFSMDVDRENERFFGQIHKGSAKLPGGLNILFDKWVMIRWTSETEAERTNYVPFFESIDQMDVKALAEIDRIVPPESGATDSVSRKESVIFLMLEGKPALDQNGYFRFAFGRGTYPCSWTHEAISERRVTVREQGDQMLIDLPANKKTFVLDKAWGFPSLIEARDYDGKRRQILRTAFNVDSDFPSIRIPPKVASLPIDGAIEQMCREIQSTQLSLRFEEVVTRWDRIERAGKERDVERIFGEWLAYYLDTLYQFNIHRQARQYVQLALDQGQKMADLEKNSVDFIKAFKAWSAQGHEKLEAFLKGELGDLERQLSSELIEKPIDSRLHPLIWKLRKDLFDFKTIETVRSAEDDAKADRILREELEAARKL